MQLSRSLSWLQRSFSLGNALCTHQHRKASLTSAIERGIRTGKRGVNDAEKRRLERPFESYSRRDGTREGSGERTASLREWTRPERSEYSRKGEESSRRRLGGSSSAKPWQTNSRYREGARDEKPVSDRGSKGRWTKERDIQSRANAQDSEKPLPYSQKWEEGSQESGFDGTMGSARSDSAQDSLAPAKYSREHGSDIGEQRLSGRRDFGEQRSNGRRDFGREGYAQYSERSPGSFRERKHDFEDPRSSGRGDREERRKFVPESQPEVSKRQEGEPEAGRPSLFRENRLSVNAPLAIPFTTAGSEFVYGTFAVKAALQSGRRKLHKLYVYNGEQTQDETPRDLSIQKLALAAGVLVKEVGGDWNRLLSKMTASRPHNGYVLEASPIPKLPITALQETELSDQHLNVDLAHQSAEELAVNSCFNISDDEASIAREDLTRYPLILLLDRILDPGNLGAIIRSAYFLGADALAVVDHGTSPFSAVTVKASAGAAETFPILIVKKEHQFIKASQENGWKFFAATSPDSMSAVSRSGSTKADLPVASALRDHPCVLMLGNEGEGLRPALQKLADGVASIENARGSEVGVDSLNVSVAAALLMQDFLRGSKSTQSKWKDVPRTSVDNDDDEALF